MIPYGYSVTMYDSDDFTGEAFTIDGPKYQNSELDMACITLNDFHRRMESVVVYRTEDGHVFEEPEPTLTTPEEPEPTLTIPEEGDEFDPDFVP